MLTNSGGSTAALCPAMAAAWSPSHHDFTTLQQPITYQPLSTRSSSGALPTHAVTAAPATFHPRHQITSNPAAAAAAPADFPMQYSPQYTRPQQSPELRQSNQDILTSSPNHWNTQSQTSQQPSNAPMAANPSLHSLPVYQPVPAASTSPHAHVQPQQSPTMLPMQTSNQSASPQHNLTAAIPQPAQNSAAPLPVMVMPVSVANQTIPTYHHPHHPANLTSQPEQSLSTQAAPQRPFYHGMPAMSIQPSTPAATSVLFHEPITQKQRTQPLRDWIVTHRSHPYPTRDEKLALAMLTHMRVDQVTMWFANTRRQIRRIGMKAWSGGLYDTALPYRIGNGAIIPVTGSQSDVSNEDEDSNTSNSPADSSSQVPTDSSGSLD